MLLFIDDVVDELGSREEISYIFKMMEQGTGADRQLKQFYDNKNDFKKLVDYIIDETYTGLDFVPKPVSAKNKPTTKTNSK